MKVYLKKVLVKETSVSGMLTIHCKNGYIIISAFRYGDSDPDLLKKNMVRSDKLKSDIKSSGFSYIPVWGGFEETSKDINEKPVNVNEQIFVIFNYKRLEKQDTIDELKKLGNQLCKKYDQESFFLKDTDGKGYFLDGNGSVQQTFSSISPTEEIDVYFSFLDKRRRNDSIGCPLTYREGVLYLAKPPLTLAEAYIRSPEVFFRF